MLSTAQKSKPIFNLSKNICLRNLKIKKQVYYNSSKLKKIHWMNIKKSKEITFQKQIAPSMAWLYAKLINNLAIANEKQPVVAFDNEGNLHMSVFISKVHYNAKLKRFIVSYNTTYKTLNCGCGTRKIVCIHKAMSIWFLEQTHVITQPDLGNTSPELTKKACYDETKNEKEE